MYRLNWTKYNTTNCWLNLKLNTITMWLYCLFCFLFSTRICTNIWIKWQNNMTWAYLFVTSRQTNHIARNIYDLLWHFFFLFKWSDRERESNLTMQTCSTVQLSYDCHFECKIFNWNDYSNCLREFQIFKPQNVYYHFITLFIKINKFSRVLNRIN